MSTNLGAIQFLSGSSPARKSIFAMVIMAVPCVLITPVRMPQHLTAADRHVFVRLRISGS